MDAFIAKINSDGETSWIKQFGGASDDYANALSIDRFALTVAGYTYGTISRVDGYKRKGGADIFLAQFSGDEL